MEKVCIIRPFISENESMCVCVCASVRCKCVYTLHINSKYGLYAHFEAHCKRLHPSLKWKKVFFDLDWNEMETANWQLARQKETTKIKSETFVAFISFLSVHCACVEAKRTKQQQNKNQENTTIEWYKKKPLYEIKVKQNNAHTIFVSPLSKHTKSICVVDSCRWKCFFFRSFVVILFL